MIMIIASLCSGLVGLALLSAAAWTSHNQRDNAIDGVTTTGTVVDLSRELTNPGNPGVYCPTVEFSLPTGEKVIFTSKFGSRPAAHIVGQSVTVRYDPEAPQAAEVESALSQWLVPGILAFIGILFCCLGIAFFVFFGVLPFF